MEWKGGGIGKFCRNSQTKGEGVGGGRGGVSIGSNLGESIRCGYWKNRGG